MHCMHFMEALNDCHGEDHCCQWFFLLVIVGPPHYLVGLLASLVIWPKLSTSSNRLNFFAFSTFSNVSRQVYGTTSIRINFFVQAFSTCLNLSQQVYGTTGASYGAPSSGYGAAPSSSYGAPSSSYGSRSNYDYPVVSFYPSPKIFMK